MPPRRRILDDDFDVGSDSGSSEHDSEEENVSDGNQIENLKRTFDSMDNDAFVTILKKAVCTSVLEVASAAGTSSNRGRRVNRASVNAAAAAANDDKEVTTRFNVKAFSEVLQSLNERKRQIITSYGFGSCAVPLSFAAWLCEHVDCRLGDIVINNKSIKLSPKSVHYVLGIPLGGRDVLMESVDSRDLFVSPADPTKLATVYELQEKMARDDLNDDEIVRTFLSMSLSYFLCPFSSVNLSPKFLGPLVEVREAAQWDWSKLVYDWLIKMVERFQVRKTSRHGSTSLGGCLYYVCVVYLDHLDFAQHVIPPPIFPRTKVWKADMVDKFSQLDRSRSRKDKYGHRPVRDFRETCYQMFVESEQAEPSSAADEESLKLVLENLVDNSLPPEVLAGITEICSKHSRGANQQRSVHGAVLDVVKHLYDASRREKCFDSSQRHREDPGSQFGDAFDYGHCPEADHDDGPEIDRDSDGDAAEVGGRGTNISEDRFAEIVGEANASNVCSGDTVILPSSGNGTEGNPSAGGTGDTVILPSSRGTDSDDARVNEVPSQKKSRFASESCGGSSQSGGSKGNKSRRSADVVSDSLNSVGTRTRARQEAPTVVEDLESVLKQNRRKKRLVCKKIYCSSDLEEIG